MTKIIESEGWKGISGQEIISLDEQEIILRSWTKNKETKERYCTDTKVILEDIKFLWELMKERFDVGKEYGSHFVWRLIIEGKKLQEKEGVTTDYMIKHFLGYRQKRIGTDYYFRYYFYPIKVLESLGYIELLGRGRVIINHKKEFEITKK